MHSHISISTPPFALGHLGLSDKVTLHTVQQGTRIKMCCVFLSEFLDSHCRVSLQPLGLPLTGSCAFSASVLIQHTEKCTGTESAPCNSQLTIAGSRCVRGWSVLYILGTINEVQRLRKVLIFFPKWLCFSQRWQRSVPPVCVCVKLPEMVRVSGEKWEGWCLILQSSNHRGMWSHYRGWFHNSNQGSTYLRAERISSSLGGAGSLTTAEISFHASQRISA